MSLILNIDTATEACSVALSVNRELLALAETYEPRAHAAVLTSLIEEVFKKSGLFIKEIDAVAISRGPGSYTGLRIGTAAAKALCYGLEKPMISVCTLKAMTAHCLSENYSSGNLSDNAILIPLIDARRMEVYCAGYDAMLNELFAAKAEIITHGSFSEYAKDSEIIFFGDGTAKCKEALQDNLHALFIEKFYASAKGMINLSEKKFKQKEFEDIALFEPAYLKDFAGKLP